MLEQFHGFPRARTLLPEASDPPSIGVSTGAGEPLLPAPDSPETGVNGSSDPIAVDRAVAELEALDMVEIAFRRDEPGRAGQLAPWPDWVSGEVRACYRERGVAQPYAHQRDALDAIQQAASGSENLMQPILTAVDARASLGEIADALRAVFGEYQERLII